MSLNIILTSLHGRKIGLSATGGVLIAPTSSTGMSHLAEISSAGVFNSSITGFGSTITEMTVAKQKSVVDTISSSAATLLNYGLSVISSDVINVSVLVLPAPETGLHKQIWGDSSASTVTLTSTAASITFDTTVGSSVLVFDKAGGIRGSQINLRGLSATRWAVLARTAIS